VQATLELATLFFGERKSVVSAAAGDASEGNPVILGSVLATSQ
jgi:hypothetical protein